MPLSEDEQRILKEIEQQFYATDPQFAHEVATTSVYRHSLRRMKLAGLAFVAGTVLMVWMLWLGNFVLSFLLGLLPMFAAVVWFEHNLRKLGRAGLAQVTKSMRASNFRDALGNAGKRARERFRRDDE